MLSITFWNTVLTAQKELLVNESQSLTQPGFYLEKYFWGGSVLQCNEYNSLLQKYTLCRGSGGVSPRKFSDFEMSLSHF